MVTAAPPSNDEQWDDEQKESNLSFYRLTFIVPERVGIVTIPDRRDFIF
jgi:hypothetical protein